ncbi:hypothetical protein Nepgr_013032 [Nepenthes gracilis]|uniref:Uncharacterized protein n=1 Tax=Nepenthes gracilis TaxID=150966 RepID=A0AAD3XNX2_NEPGR|nr:hypothetical protein Nepgr_013032 [Nepenthes gracilis]
MASDAPEFLVDKKWRPSRKESTNKWSSSTSFEASLRRTCSQKITSSKAPSISRSFSLKTSSATSKLSSLSKSPFKTSNPSPPLGRSSSTKNSPPLIRSLSQKGSAFTRKCSTLAKNRRQRFYIMRRCVTMLVCWRKDCDS